MPNEVLVEQSIRRIGLELEELFDFVLRSVTHEIEAGIEIVFERSVLQIEDLAGKRLHKRQ